MKRGVTLLELLVVVVVIGILATAAVRTWDVTMEKGRYEETFRELEEIARAIVGDERMVVAGERIDFGFVGDCGMLPRNLIDLTQRPDYVDSLLWRGPYVKSTFAENPRSFLFDAWGDSYIYIPESLFIRSFGGGSDVDYRRWVTKRFATRVGDLLNNRVSGFIEDAFGNRPKGSDLSYLSLYLFYPWQGQTLLDSIEFDTLKPGEFSFGPIPQGKVRLVAVYKKTMPPDSIDRYLTVYPKIGKVDLIIRFGNVLF